MYLNRLIKNKILNNKGKKSGYILSNFPETIKQAQNLFNLEDLVSKNENTNDFNNAIYPSICYKNYFYISKFIMYKFSNYY